MSVETYRIVRIIEGEFDGEGQAARAFEVQGLRRRDMYVIERITEHDDGTRTVEEVDP